MPPLGRPRVEQRIAQRGEVGLAQQRGEHRDREQREQPGHVDRERHRQRGQRDQVLHRGQQQGEEPDPAHRLAPRPLELVVDLRVLELLEVERRGVAHQLDAGAVGEEIAQQALEQRRHAAEAFAHERDAELQGEQLAEPHPGDGAAGTDHRDRLDHLVHDQLADPEHRERHQRPGQPQQQDADDVPGLGLPHHPQQTRQMAQRLEALPPGDVDVFRPAAAGAVGADDGVLQREGHQGKVIIFFP